MEFQKACLRTVATRCTETVEQEQIQKRTFTNWMNAQLSKRTPPTVVQDLFTDLQDGMRLLDLLEVMSGQRMKRERGHGLFQHRGNIETALKFLKSKSVKLVNINIPDLIEGRPSIVLGLIWTIILHCHIEELASTLSFGSRQSSLESLASLDSLPSSTCSSPVPGGSPVPRGRSSPLHARFRLSAKKALLLWVRDQCRKVGFSISVKDFKSSWRSGLVFLAILCALRPDLVDLHGAQGRTALENLEEAFRLAEQELHIPRLLEPEDIDVSDPDEKSIMTYVAQFLQYSNDMPSPDEDIQLPSAPSPSCLSPINLPSYFTPAVTASPLHQASPNQKAREMACWLQKAYEELEEVWSSTEGAGYAERYQAYQAFVTSFYEQRRPVIPVLSAIRRSPKPSREQLALRQAWSTLEQKLQQYNTELDMSLPGPLNTLGLWLQRVEAVLAEEGGVAKDHAHAAREAREKQEQLKVLVQDMGLHLNTLHAFSNTSPQEAAWVPPDKLDDLKRRFTNARVTAKYYGIKLEYREQWHTVYKLLGQLNARLKAWRGPYSSQDAVRSLLQDWHEIVDKQCLVSMLRAALHKLKQTASTYTSKAALADDAQMVSRQVKEVEAETSTGAEGVMVARGTMGRVLAAWESYRDCLFSMQVWLGQQTEATDATVKEDVLREWVNRHAHLNEVGNFLIESTDSPTSFSLAGELCKVNMQWAEFVKRTRFAMSPTAPSVPACAQAAQALVEEGGWMVREPVEVSSGALRTYRKKLQVMIKKVTEVDLDALATSPNCSTETLENLRESLPRLRESLGQVQQACEGLQRGSSLLEGRLAELGHWGNEVTEALDILREWEHRGHPGLRPRVKTLVFRGLQLEAQLVSEEQELQNSLASAQGSSLPYLSISTLQDRVKEASAQTKELVGMLSCLDVKREGGATKGQPPPKVIIRAQSQPDLQHGSFAKHSPHTQLLQAQSLPDIPSESEEDKGAASGEFQEVQANSPQSRVTSQLGSSGPGHKGPDRVRADARPKKLAVVICDPQQPPSLAGVRTPAPQKSSTSQPDTPPQTPSPQIRVRTRQRQKGGSGSGTGVCKAEGPPKPPAQNEVYQKARTLARSRLEGAKHRLQQHVLEAITVFSTKTLSEEQIKKKEDTLKILKPTLLEEFLGSVEGMTPFCSEIQLREMELLALSVRGQWEACVGAVDSEGRVKALRELKDSLRTPQALVLATTCMKETDSRLEVAQPQEGQSRGTVPPSGGGEVTGDSTPLRETGWPADLTPHSAHSQGDPGACSAMETLQVFQRSSEPSGETEQEGEGSQSTQEVLKRYCAALSAFHLQLQKNTQRLSAEVPQGSATLTLLHTLLQDIQALRQETESLWFEFELQFSQCEAQLEGAEEARLRRERADLIQRWRAQQICLQARVKTLQTAITLMDPADIQTTFVNNRLDYITQNPLNITEFTLADSGKIHEELKVLDGNIQTELDRLAGFECSDSALIGTESAPQSVCSAIQQAVQNCRNCLDQQRKRLRRTDSALGELEHFLDPLQQADSHLSTLLASDASAIREDSSRLTPIQRRAQEAAAESQHVDTLLGEVGLKITLNGGGSAPASCKEVAGALRRRIEELQAHMSSQRKGGERGGKGGGQREKQQKDVEKKKEKNKEKQMEEKKKEKEKEKVEREQSLSLRRRTLVTALMEVKGAAEKMVLKEPTLPALQQRLRTLTDMESKLATQRPELQELSAQMSSQKTDPRELETLWDHTQLIVRDRREQCQRVMELLKKFQGCRSRLCLILQQAEQTISEQASYMSKDNLHRLLHRVTATKTELSGLGDGVEEIRSVCRQLQHQLRGIPGCADAPFENEADTIMDRWLDVMERTDCYLDNLRVSLALWDKLLLLGGEVDGWISRKLDSLIKQSQPFQYEQEVLRMQEELKAQEENVEHFQRRSCEIQHLLQSQEAPLELQVIESQLRKRMDQVRELFAESTDVFKELKAAKDQISAKMAACQSALQSIQDTLRSLGTTQGQSLLKKLQELSGELDTQSRQVEALQQELGLMSTMTSQQTLQALSTDTTRLQERVRTAREMLKHRREQAEKTHRLLEGKKELQEWLKSTEHWAKESQEEQGGLQVEMNRQSARVEAFRALVASAQRDVGDNPSILEDCQKLLERYNHLQAQRQSTSQTSPQESLLTDKRELQALAEEMQAWIREARQHLEALGTATLGNQAQIEGRLQQAKAMLALRQEGESRLEKLKAGTQQLLSQQEGLMAEGQHRDIQILVQDTQTQWVTVQQDAKQLSRLLQGVVERASSCYDQRQQACLRLEDLRGQAAALPRLFLWPGAMERQQAVERARALLERTKVLGPALSALRAQRKELVCLTQDPSWMDPSWAVLEDGAPDLIRELNELCAMLESSIRKEQCCHDLLQQCSQGLASLEQQIQQTGLQATGAHSQRDYTKVLAAMGRIDRDLQEATALSSLLTESLTTDGQVALRAQLQAIQDSQTSLEKAIQDMLAKRERQKQEEAERTQRLVEETSGLQRELQNLNTALEQELKAGEQHDDVSQLQKHWANLKALESHQQELLSHLQKLQGSMGTEGPERLASEEVASALGTLNKQSISLSVSLSESLRVCKERTALSVRQSIQALRLWTQSQNQNQSQSQQCLEAAQSTDRFGKHRCNEMDKTQVGLQEGEKLRLNLQGVLLQMDFLQSSVGQELMQSLEREATAALIDSATQLLGLSQTLKLAKSPVEATHAPSAQVTMEQGTVQKGELESLSTKTSFVQVTPGQRCSEARSTQIKKLDSSTQHTRGDFELTAEVTMGQSTAQESVSQTLCTKTPSKVSVLITRGQGSNEAKCTPAKTMDSDPQHAKGHFELDAQGTVEQSKTHESTSLTMGTHTASDFSVELSPSQGSTEAKSTPDKTFDSNGQHPEGKFELDVQMTMVPMTTQKSTSQTLCTQTSAKLSMELSPSQRSTEAKSSPTKASDRDPQQAMGHFELDAKVTVEQSTSHQSGDRETLSTKMPAKLCVEITPGQRLTQTTNTQAKTGQISTEAKGRPAKTLDGDVPPAEVKLELDAEVTMRQSPADESPSETLIKRPKASVEITSGQKSTKANDKPATTGQTLAGVNSTQAKTLASEAHHAQGNVELDAEVTMRQSITHKSTSDHNTQEHLSTQTPSKLSELEIGPGQTSTGVCSTSTKILDGDAQKTSAKFSAQLSTGQTSTKTIDNNERQAKASFEPDATLRSSLVRKASVEPDHGEETDSRPKPVFTIMLDTDLTGPCDSQPAADISVSGPQPSGPSHLGAMSTQHMEGMNVPERSLKHNNAQTKTSLELTAREQPKLNQKEDSPSTKKVASIILDVELPQTEAAFKEVSAKLVSRPEKSDYMPCHVEFSPDELQRTRQERITVAPTQDSVEAEKDITTENSSGEPARSKTKKVFTIILEADVSNSESLDSQNQKPVRKGSSEVSILPSGCSSLDLPKQPENSGSPEEICTFAADSATVHGLPKSMLSNISCVEIGPPENTHSVNVELDLSRQRSQDGGLLQPKVSSYSLKTAHSCTTTTDPELRIAQIVLESRETEPTHIDQTDITPKDSQEVKASGQSKSIDSSPTDTRNRREGKDVNTVTSESADAEEKTETRQSRPEESYQGVSEEASVVHIPASHGPDAISTSYVKDRGELQTHSTEHVQMDTSHQDISDFQRHILSQSPQKMSPVTSKEELHSLEVASTDLPEIVSSLENKMKATEVREVLTMNQVAGAGAVGGTRKSPQGQQHGGPLMDILVDAEPVVEARSLVGDEAVKAMSCLQPTVAEPETRLGRAVHRVLGCRYQPAQLNPVVMALQLQEAESCRQCVLQQVAAVSRLEAEQESQSQATQRMEGRWSAALLDASATVQVKEAQLLQVTQYHQQTEALRATLQRFTAEMEMLSLDHLGSTSTQAEKLQAFLKCMDQEKGKIGELLQTCCQVSAHLSEADGPIALLAQVQGLQEGWQILHGTADRTLRHATACTTEASAVLQEAKELHCKLEHIQASMDSLQSSTPLSECQMAVQLTVTASELATANEQYLNLIGVFEAFNQSFLGKKEQQEMEEGLLHLKAQLDQTQEQVFGKATSLGDSSVAKLIEVVQDFLPWAKHVEQQVEARRKVALFSEHAHHQLTNMHRLQSEVSARQTQVTFVVEQQKTLLSGLREDDVSVILSLLEDLEDTYQVVSEKVTHSTEEVEQAVQSRESMWTQILEVSMWLVAYTEKESVKESKLKASIADLKVGLQWHSAALKEAEKQTTIIKGLLEQCGITVSDLSIRESHYLIDRLTILQAEVSGVASSERAACWELEELLHAQQATAEELATIQKSLKQISMDLERQRFPVTSVSLAAVEPLRHMLVEHQCQVQEVQHCQESQKKGLLQTIQGLQAKARMLDMQAREHEKYLNYRNRMEDSRETLKKRIPRMSDRTVDCRERLQVCRFLLLELPLVKQQCQQTADQLEAISGDIYPSQLTSERQKIHRTLENLATWELAIHNELCSIERKLLDGLGSPADLTAIANVFHKARQELQQVVCLHPNEQAIVRELQKCSALQRSLDCGLRVLEALEHRKGAEPEKLRELAHYGKKISKECNFRTDNLSQAWEALKDYQLAVQGAVRFLDDAEPRLLLDLTGTRDCQEELKVTQQTVAALRDSFTAHVDRLGNLVPKQNCFSTMETQHLHIQALSLLLVREAMLEAQGHLRMETLKGHIEEQSSHRKQHVELNRLFQSFASRLTECLLLKATSFEECLEQQEKAKALQEEVWCLAGRLEQLRGSCPALAVDCGVPAELGLPLLWRQWAQLKHRVGVLRARSVQREQEWKDAVLNMERSSLALEGLSQDLCDPATVRGSLDELRVTLAQTELQQERLDNEHQALAATQALIGRLLRPCAQRDPDKPVQIYQEMQNLQSHCKRLREQCMLVRRTALMKIQERGRDLEEIDTVRQRVVSLLTLPEAHCDAPQAEEAKAELSSQRAKLEVIIEGVRSRYQEIPLELQASLEEATHSLQEVEGKLTSGASQQSDPQPQHSLSAQVREVTEGLEKVQDLLQQSSPSVAEAERTLKRVWDELDHWHSQLAVLEAEVQEVAMEQPEQGHTLMDELTDPLQLYQMISKQAEQRTAFLSRIPACLQEYEDLLNSAAHWQDEAKSWLNTPHTYTTAKCLHGHALSLQMALDDSERIQAALEAFVPVMQEISPVCDTDIMQERLKKAILNVTYMQQCIMEPHAQLQHVAEEVDAIETEVKTMEKNVTKINAILSSMDSESTSVEEQLQYCQVIVENIRSMRRTLSEIEQCWPDLGLPRGAEETLTVFQRAQSLQQPMQELEQRTQEQSTRLQETLGLAMDHPLRGLEETTSSQPGLLSLSSEESPPRGSLSVPKETASVTVTSEANAEVMGSLASKVPLIPAHTCENSESGRTADSGSIMKRPTKPLSKMNGEARAEPGDIHKEPDWTGIKSEDLECAPKDPQSASKQPDSVTIESKSATIECPSIIHNVEAITKDQATTTKELASITSQPSSVLSSPSGKLITNHEPQMKTPAVDAPELQGSPTESERAPLHTPVHVQELLASSVTKESITKPPESPPTGLTLTDKTQGPEEDSSLGFQRGLKKTADLNEEFISADSNGNVKMISPTQKKACASFRAQPAVDSVSAQPEEGAPAKGDLALLLGSLSGSPELDSPVFILQEAVAKQADHSTMPAGHPQYASSKVLTSLFGRGEPEPVGSDAELQVCAETLLGGLSTLLKLGTERLQRSHNTKICSRSQLQPLLSRHKKFFQDVGCHWALLQYASQRLPPGALQSLDELEEKVDSLQKQAINLGSQMCQNLQEWSQWEEASGRLALLLDELEAGMPSGGPRQEPEGQLQERATAQKHLRQLLEESRPELGLVLDQCLALEHRGCSPLGATTTVLGSGLELRWASVHRRLQMEETHSDQMRKQWKRFQEDSQVLQEWLCEARDQLQAWDCHPDSEPPELSCIQLTQLMGLCQQVEVRRAQWSSAHEAGTQLLHLMDSEAPCLQEGLAQLEQNWADVTSCVPVLQSWVKQILCALPVCELLPHLSAWLGSMENRLEKEEEEVVVFHWAVGAAARASQLQRCQYLKAEISSYQPCIERLSQLVEEAGHVKDEADREERTHLAEQVGALHLRWLLVQAKADSQTRQVEGSHQVCSQRESRLGRLRTWVAVQMERLRGYKRPDSCFHIDKALQEIKETEEKLSLRLAELLELKAVRLSEVKDHPSDQNFSALVEEVAQDLTLLTQQVASLIPSLQHVRDQWVRFERELAEATVVSAQTQYNLTQQQRRPCLSLQESSAHVEHMQVLQQQAEKAADLWSSVHRSLASLSERVSPGAGRLLSERVEREEARWRSVVEASRDGCQRSQALQQLWQEYVRLTGICSGRLTQLWEKCQGTPAHAELEGDPMERIQASLESMSDIHLGMEKLQTSVGEVLEAAKLLIGQIEPQGSTLIQSETRLLSRNVLHLSQALTIRREQLQEDLEQYQNFSSSLESLELHLRGFESGLLRPSSSLDDLKRGVLELSGLTPDLGSLNELSIDLRLTETAEQMLRTLNDQWLLVFTQATDRYRKMHATQLSSQSFKQRSEDWLALLEKMEGDLTTDICATQSAIREQLTQHQRLKVEMFAGQQLLQSVVPEALQLLESGPSGDSNLVVRLTECQERWQEALRLAEKRGTLLQSLMGQWRLLSSGQRRLWRLLSDMEPLLPPAGLAACSLHQLRDVIQDFEWAQRELQCHTPLYSQVLEAGRELIPRLDGPSQSHVWEDLDALKKSWEDTQRLLGVRKALAESVILTWKRCQAGLADSTLKLEEIKASLDQPLPENLEELHKEEKLSKAQQDAVEVWDGHLRELGAMKADASQYVLARDTALLQGQLDLLSGHWEELCLKVSLRKQEIADRLHAWVVFNNKNKELCDWLIQMQSKVAHSGEHLSIEEMVDKLKKDCMEEINLFSENKSHLKQLGEQLLSASDKTKEAEIHGALRDINARWQSLFDHIEARVKKLKDTLVTVQQLDKDMNNLRTWLSHIEKQLSQPILYSICHSEEIQRTLAEQQELQRDIEQHTDSMASVLTLCDALLCDEDVCESSGGGGDGVGIEGDSIQQTTRSLEQRWRNICSLSLERRLRIEETWRLWCKFKEDHSRFEEWLTKAERVATNPNSSNVLYVDAKEELKSFEAFQREVHERLTQLEVINHQYRQLARENRIDSSSQLKATVRLVNQRWDTLQRRTGAILRRLRYFTAQREDFESTREGLLVWLTELDLQLTNVEHFSESDIHEKLKRLNGFQKEITLNTNRIDELIVFGEALIQRSTPPDAAHIEDELVELHTYCQEVFRRAARFHHRLTSPHPELTEEVELRQVSAGMVSRQCPSSAGEQSLALAPVCLVPSLLERSGRETPVSVDSIPLEWDHTGDVGGSSSHEDDEEGTYYSTLSDVDVTESAEAFVKASAHLLRQTSGPGKSLAETQSWHSQDSQLDLTDSARHTPTQASTPLKQGYVRLMSECSGSIKSVKRVSLILDDEQQEELGLTGLTTADKQSGVIERWELLQAQAMSEEMCTQRDPQQLTSDLSDITSWLGQVTPELQQLQKPESDTTIEAMEAKVRHLKEMQKTFARYKAMMLSLNLGGQELQQQQCQEEGEAERLEGSEGTGAPGCLQEALRCMNQGWTDACSCLEAWESNLRTTLMRCQEFHETLHALLLWLAHAESRRYTVDIRDESTSLTTLHEHKASLKCLEEELLERQRQVGSLQELTAQLLPEAGGDDSIEAREKLHVISNKLRLLLRQVGQDLRTMQKKLDSAESPHQSRELTRIPGSKDLPSEPGSRRSSAGSRAEKREPSPQRSFFQRVLRAAFPLHLLFLLLLVLACLVPLSEDDFSCTLANNFARSFYPMLRYTNGPPPT